MWQTKGSAHSADAMRMASAVNNSLIKLAFPWELHDLCQGNWYIRPSPRVASIALYPVY